jgi:hypothetical protein
MRIIVITLLVSTLLAACSTINDNKNNKITVNIDSVKYQSVADSLICDVIIKNPDKEDKWIEQCLKDLKKEAFIDSLFADIYAQKITAFEYYSNTPLTLKQIKEIENGTGYSRNIIGKMQFNECWKYDRASHCMIKKVNSVVFGYETYDTEGAVRGYKPLFKVLFN